MTNKLQCFSIMSLTNRVNNALAKNEHCRDSDVTLCAEIWNQECQEQDLDFSSLSAVLFLHLIDTGKLSKQQSILRSRRSVGQKRPELKGKSYMAKTKNKPEYIKNKPLPNLSKRSGMANIDVSSLLGKNGRHQFSPNPSIVGRSMAEQGIT